MTRLPCKRQRGAVTLMGALFLIMVIIVLLDTVQRMAASDITDTALQNDSVEALFIAESGLERAAWRYSTGTSCTALAGESDTVGRGNFQVVAATLAGSLCSLRVQGSVTTTLTGNAAVRTIDGELTAGSSGGWGWAVGDDGGGETILQWDGSSWSRAGPYGNIPNKDLNGLHCIDQNDCWAVGKDEGGELIIHWNGSNWSRVGPYSSIPNKELYDVTCISTNDCWAVGKDEGGELIIHWNGSNWSRVGPYGSIPNKKLYSVHCAGSSDCWAVGKPQGGELIIHWDGSSWSRFGPYSSVTNRNLRGVSCISSGSCWAVGDDKSGENINIWNGSTWTRQGPYSSIPNRDLDAIHMISATTGCAVGQKGTIAYWDGSGWAGQSSPTNRQLNDVYVSGGASGGSVSLVKWTEPVL